MTDVSQIFKKNNEKPESVLTTSSGQTVQVRSARSMSRDSPVH